MASTSPSSAGASSGFSEDSSNENHPTPPITWDTRAQNIPTTRRKSSLLASFNAALKSRTTQRKASKDAGYAKQSTKSIDIELANGYVQQIEQLAVENVTQIELQPAYELRPGVGVQYCP